MIRAIVYTRFSPRRNADTSESCETQQAYCEQYAHSNDMEIAEVFEDREVSGSEEDRPLLWSAIDALKKGSVLLVYKHDRLARNVYLSECIRREVEKMGARIVAVQGDIEGDTPEVIMIRQVLASVAEYERKVIAIRTSHAMQHHQSTGRRMSRHAPYGTMVDPQDDTRLIPNPVEVPAVRMIKTMHGRGCSAHEMVVELQESFLDACRGKRWTQRTIKRVMARLNLS